MAGFPLGSTNYFVEMGYNEYIVVKTLSTDASWACVGIINKIDLTFKTDLLLIGIPKDVIGLVIINIKYIFIHLL